MIHVHFGNQERDFELHFCYLAIDVTGQGKCTVTPSPRNGDRYAVGNSLLGSPADRVFIEHGLGAKCYRETDSIGVKGMSQLVSRIRNRQFGISATLSYFTKHLYEDVREDGMVTRAR